MRQPTKQIAKRRRKEAAAVPALDAQALAREVGARINAILEASGPTIRAILEEPEAKTWKASSVPEVLARLGTSRTADVVVVLEATLDQFAGVLEIIARYGEATGQAEAPLPPALAGQVEHVRALAGAAETTLRVLRGPSPQSPAIADVFRDGLASLPTYQSLWGVLQAIQEGRNALQQWTDNNGQTVPMRKVYTDRHGNPAYLSIRTSDGDLRPSGTVIANLWERLKTLDDVSSDVLVYCLCAAVAAGGSPTDPIWVSADRILDERGISRITSSKDRYQHGHRREDRFEIGRALAILSDLWLQVFDIEVIPASSRRKAKRVEASGPLLLTRQKWAQTDFDGGGEVFLVAQVILGPWVEPFWNLLRWQTGLIAQKALEYDPYRERPEKRLAKYLAFHIRLNTNRSAEVLKRRVSTLLEAIGDDAIRVDEARPMRVRDRLEQALGRLTADGVIAGWSYAVEQPSLPLKKWLEQWMAWVVVIEPAKKVAEQYALVRREHPALKPPDA